MKKYIILILMLLFININVYAEGEATLKNIKVNGISVNCDNYVCDIEVPSNTYKITYDRVDPNATIEGARLNIEGKFEAENAIEKLTVINGENRVEYTFNLTKRLLNSDISLLKLVINKKDQIVYQDRYTYNIEVDYDVDKISVSANTNDKNAKVEGNLEFDFPLELSTSSFNFTVVAEDTSVKQTYSIYAIRKAAPSTKISKLTIKEIPEFVFDPDVTEYNLELLYNYNCLTIDYELEKENSELEIKNNENFKVGLNIVELVVTNEKAVSKYILNITRLDDVDINLANLSILKINGDDKFKFDPTVSDYDLYFEEIPEQIHLYYEVKEKEGVVTITGNENLVEGSKVEIRVDLQNPRVYRIYTLNIKTKKEEEEMNKDLIFILMIILIVVMVLLLILQIVLDKKDKKKNKIKKEEEEKRNKKNKIYDFSETNEMKVVKEEEDIEII